MTTLRGIPIDGARPIRTPRAMGLLRLADPDLHAALLADVHWPFPEAEGPGLCGVSLVPGVTFAGVNDQSLVTCSDCLEWMRS